MLFFIFIFSGRSIFTILWFLLDSFNISKNNYDNFFEPISKNLVDESKKQCNNKNSFLFFSAFRLVRKRVTCDEYSRIEKIKDVGSLAECASFCGHVTQMFAFGTNEFDGKGCKEGKCTCSCQFVTENYQCLDLRYSRDYNLYSFQVGGKWRIYFYDEMKDVWGKIVQKIFERHKLS